MFVYRCFKRAVMIIMAHESIPTDIKGKTIELKK